MNGIDKSPLSKLLGSIRLKKHLIESTDIEALTKKLARKPTELRQVLRRLSELLRTNGDGTIFSHTFVCLFFQKMIATGVSEIEALELFISSLVAMGVADLRRKGG